MGFKKINQAQLVWELYQIILGGEFGEFLPDTVAN